MMLHPQNLCCALRTCFVTGPVTKPGRPATPALNSVPQQRVCLTADPYSPRSGAVLEERSELRGSERVCGKGVLESRNCVDLTPVWEPALGGRRIGAKTEAQSKLRRQQPQRQTPSAGPLIGLPVAAKARRGDAPPPSASEGDGGTRPPCDGARADSGFRVGGRVGWGAVGAVGGSAAVAPEKALVGGGVCRRAVLVTVGGVA